MNQKGFKPYGDYIIVEACGQKDQTSSGIYIKPKENRQYGKGKVISIGAGIMNEKGKLFPLSFKEDDYVIYDKQQGVDAYMGYGLIKIQSVIAIVDKDTEVS